MNDINRVEGIVDKSKTILNLATAFSCEMSAYGRYSFFAEKMYQEGYYSVASLFRACSFSEQVHASCHAKVALFLGGTLNAHLTPTSNINIPEMIADMLHDEEKAMSDYPQFIQEAKEEGFYSAVQTFAVALKTDTIHAKYCQQAASSPDYWKFEKHVFYTCYQCGLVREYEKGTCPVCGGPINHFNSFEYK